MIPISTCARNYICRMPLSADRDNDNQKTTCTEETTNASKNSFLPFRGGIVLIGFLLIAGYFLVTEHRAHLALAIPYLPFLLLLACPFMHFFMHGGHGT